MLADALLRILDASGPLWALLGGTLAGLLCGLMPGLSGRIALLIALPFAITLEPFAGVTFLIALHAVVHTSGSIPAILFGIPTSASESATVVDGYPMVRANRGGEAIGSVIASSAVGGVLGAVALMLLVPILMPLISLLGTPEVAMLALIGLASIASLSGSSPAAGFVVAACGVLLSMVGVDTLTGTPRYTFDFLELWDGVNIAAVIAGIFVIPEMLARVFNVSTPAAGTTRFGEVLEGCFAAFRRMFLMIRSATIGILVGFLPGIGASVAVWLAYGHAAQTTKPSTPFGHGAVEGVIAPETANNSKEGGALMPTLFFGVPGSSGMAILIAAFATMGIEVGPRLVETDPGFILSLGWIILFANLMALPVCFGFAPYMLSIARIRRTVVVPIALTFATAAVFMTAPGVVTLVELAVFGAMGTLFALAGWPRAPFVLGFVIGPIFESALARTVSIWGTSALWRPGVLVLTAIAILVIFAGRRARRQPRTSAALPDLRFPILLAAAIGVLLMAAAAWAILRFPGTAAVAPLAAAGIGTAAAVALTARMTANPAGISQETVPILDRRALLLFTASLAMAGIFGIGFAAAILVGGSFYWIAQRSIVVSFSAGVTAGLLAALAAGEVALSPY
jgi:putative tricarboxylic transport membrane protein